MEQLSIIADDGYCLSALYGEPLGKSAGMVVISSATGIKKEFYINFSRWLVGRGYTVLLFDYRGIGGSAPDDIRTFKSYMHEWGTRDMNAVMDYLVNTRKLTDITWFGHSAGAQLVGFVKKREHIRKIISFNAAMGYWGYLAAPMKWLIWGLWYFLGPVMIKVYGYGAMTKIGWGEDLPPNMLMQWREWCLSKTYFQSCLQQQLQKKNFDDFIIPITAVYTSDDFIANDKTVPLMMQFFPNAPQEIIKLQVKNYTSQKVGHIGIFRKRFENSLWPFLLSVIERKPAQEPKSYITTGIQGGQPVSRKHS